jgi:peroxiredoxin
MSATTIGLTLQFLTLLTVFAFLYLLLRQQGRILLRLDAIQGAAPPAPAVTGLAVATPIADFGLPDLDGKQVALQELHGRRVLLTYWSPECGFCDMAAGELAALQLELRKANTELLLVSDDNAESNRKLIAEHSLNCRVLLMGENSAAYKYLAGEVFQNCGTPSAYLLDEEHRVSQPLAVGMVEVVELARQAAATVKPAPKAGMLKTLPISASRIEREGLPAGTPAPSFSLPDIHGQTVSLNHFRGRKTLLVFTDPHCGPCEHLMPDLVQLHRKHGNNGLAVVMVGRGDAEENKRKALKHNVGFPVVLQDRWKLSRQYGIFATPVAFLIGTDGVILKNVATGREQIMTLAHEGLASN